MKKQISFRQYFLMELLRCAHLKQENNWDAFRYGEFKGHMIDLDKSSASLNFFIENLPRMERVIPMLEDEASRNLLVTLMLYRVLGPGHVKLPTNNEKYWQHYHCVDQYVKEAAAAKSWIWDLDLLEHEGIQYFGHRGGILVNFVLSQYFYRGSARVCPDAGDVVIDGGACWGDTALVFAKSVGASGQVFSFEFVDSNIGIIERNLGLNPDLAPRIKVVKNALSERSGERLSYVDRGPRDVSYQRQHANSR